MRALLNRLLYLLRRSRHDADLRDEMETHRSLRQDKLERDGITQVEAAQASRRSLGNVALAREDVRQVWIVPALEGVWQDLRGALRSSRRSVASSVTIVVTLVFGLGLASAIFAFGDGHLARPLPFPDDERLYVVRTTDTRHGMLRADEAEGLRTGALSALGFVKGTGGGAAVGFGVLQLEGRQVRVSVDGVDENFAQVMGVPLVEGRLFEPDDYRGTKPVPVWLAHRFWQREFNGDRTVLNRTLFIQSGSERVPVVIVGIVDPRITTFDPNFGRNNLLPDLFAPTMPRQPATGPTNIIIITTPIVRLPQDMSREQAETAIGAALQGISPAPQGETRKVRLDSLREELAGGGRPTAMLFVAGALLALALVTVNLIHLLLARGVARAGEIATRSALGASRWRIARLLLFESLLYGVAGIGGGLLVGRWLAHTIAAGLPERGSDTSNLALVAMTFDLRAVAFAAVAGAVVTVFGAAWPVWLVVFRSSGPVHRMHRRSGARLSARFSRLTLTCEVAISTIILMGTVFVGLGIWRYVNQPLGFDLEDRFALAFPSSSVTNDAAVDWPAVLEAVRAVPGIRSASVDQMRQVKGRLHADAEDLSERDVTAASVAVSLLETRGVDLMKGRWIEPAEVEANAPVAIVDTKFARTVWPDADPLGKSVRVEGEPARTVVGVVSHQRFSLVRDAPGIAYFVQSRVDGRPNLHIWAPGLTAADLMTRLTGPLQGLAPGYAPVVRAETFESVFLDDLADARFQRPIIIALGLFALTLATIGLFGLVAYLVEQRTRDFGIRLALGARRGDVLKEVVWQSAVPGMAGLIIGLTASWALESMARATMAGWESSGPVAAAVVSAAVLLAVVFAAAGPARRVLRIDPAVVLRAE